MAERNSLEQHQEFPKPGNEKSITIDEKNGTVGHISAELGVNMKWLDSILGNHQNRPRTYVTKNNNIPGKGEGTYEERYWASPRKGETYSFRENEDPSTGGTLIRTRGNEVISIPVPPEAINKKLSSIKEIQQHTQAQLAELKIDIETA